MKRLIEEENDKFSFNFLKKEKKKKLYMYKKKNQKMIKKVYIYIGYDFIIKP